VIEQLRDLAAQLRKAASEMPERNPAEPAVKTAELDSEKVRDFLVFFGASK